MRIGIDLGGTNVRGGIVSWDWNITNYSREPFRNQGTLDETLGQLIEFIRPMTGKGIVGIGIGVPSVVDLQQGIVYNVTNIPSWEKVPLKDIIQKQFNVPVEINNDVNCFILGEHRHGLVKGLKNVVGVSCGTGLGAGVIINGELFSGTNCGAGEVGLLHYLDHNIEYYASGNLFKVQFNTTAEEAHRQAVNGAAWALEAWKEFGEHLAEALKSVVYTFDPEAIVLGGSLSKAFALYETPMKIAMKNFEFPESIRRLKIYQTQNENITLLGAAALVSES
ncbi:MAG TPA: ROK family protein [Chryseolinea sp.]|nr:ROK family protein [Chryseolinea sp.]